MSIREVPDKPGVFDVVVYGRKRADGTRPRQTKRVAGQRNAESVHAAFIAARDQGKPIGPTGSVSAYLAEWLEGREHNVAAQTFANYSATVRRYINPHVGKLKLSELTPKDVRSMDARLAKAGLSGSTRLYAYRVLAMAMRQAVLDHEIAFSPCDSVKPPKSSRTEPPALTPEELLELLTCLEGTLVYLPAVLAFDTGARREEILALHWSEVDFAKRTIRIVLAVEQVGNVVRIKEPKSDHSKRRRTLSEPLIEALKAHRKEQLEFRAKHANLWRDEDLVFPSRFYHSDDFPMGRIWSPNAFSHAWRVAMNEVNSRRLGALVAAGGRVEDFEPWQFGIHRLRHTFITHQLKSGTRLEIVSRAAGHRDSSVTLRLYSHLFEQEDAETAVVTGALLSRLGQTEG